MTLTTANMGLLQAQGTDNARDYLKTFLAASLASIDAHDHSSTKGVPVKRLANGTFASRPAAGNAGHVYLSTDANRVTWDNGSSWIEAVINATSLAVSLGGGLTVTAGGLTVTAGGLQVTAGNVGIGTASTPSTGVFVTGALTTGTTQYGVNVQPTLSNASSSAQALNTFMATPNGFTTPFAAQLRLQGGQFGTTQSIVSLYGLYLDPVAAPVGTTNNYGIYINAPSGGSGANRALYAAGVSVFGGGVSGGGVIVDNNAGTAPVATAGQMGIGAQNSPSASIGANGAPPAQVGGYLVWNLGGTVIKVPWYNN